MNGRVEARSVQNVYTHSEHLGYYCRTMQYVTDVLKNHPASVGGIVSLGLFAFAAWKLRRKPKSKRVCGVDYPRDTVIVHQFPKGIFTPSIGHFVMKLETYLRIAKIPYQPNYEMIPGPKKKMPWAEYNGNEIADSHFIIKFLNKEFGVDLNKGLTPKEKAQAWAIQKWVEEFTYWLNVYSRWVLRVDDFWPNYSGFPSWQKNFIVPHMTMLCYTVGIGRHSGEEIAELMKHDLIMLSELLGDNKFMMGDEPAEVDCAVFGILSQVRWSTPHSCPGKQLLIGQLTNLKQYCDRVRELYWPDWNDLITGPGD